MKIIPGNDQYEQRTPKKQEPITMKSELEKLLQQKKALQSQLVEVQTMLYLIDYYISEELLKDIKV